MGGPGRSHRAPAKGSTSWTSTSEGVGASKIGAKAFLQAHLRRDSGRQGWRVRRMAAVRPPGRVVATPGCWRS
jgi:hypothetical protein